MSEPAPNALDRRLATLCRQTATSVAAMCADSQPAPLDGSIQAIDVTPTSQEFLEQALAHRCADAYGAADLQLKASRDLLLGLSDVLVNSSTVLAIIAVSRSCAEASSRALWLCDSTISRHKRATRSIAEFLQSKKEEHRSSLTNIAEDRLLIDRAGADARWLKIKLSKVPSNKYLQGAVPQVCGPDARPSNTNAVIALLEPISSNFGRVAYSLWSASTHATIYGLFGHLVSNADGQGVELKRNSQATIATVAAACVGYTFAITQRFICSGNNKDSLLAGIAEIDQTWREIFDEYRDLFSGKPPL